MGLIVSVMVLIVVVIPKVFQDRIVVVIVLVMKYVWVIDTHQVVYLIVHQNVIQIHVEIVFYNIIVHHIVILK